MKTKEITHIAFLACIMMVMYTAFSNVLYLEAITFTIMIIAVCFPFKESFIAAIVFGLLILLFQGIFPWTIMDLLLFPTYVWICHGLKKPLIQSSWLSILVCFLLSFLLGQLIDLPFLLFSKEVTVLYWVMGLKTSLIQGFISAVLTAFLFEPVCDRIHKLQGERK